MKLETFFNKFAQFADAPNAVAKMRELVLQWAVQGRLVRQDSNEEPASKLIRDAVHARKKLAAAKVVRDGTPDLGFLDQVENGLPNGWVHAPLSVYVGVIMGQSPPSSAYNESGEGVPFYQGKSQFGRLYPTATDWCTEPTKIGEPGDVVISVRAPVGPTNMLREKSCIGRGLTSLRSLGGDQMHLLYTLRAFERSIAAMGVGSTFVAISKGDLDDFWIPIPPLAEQKRIVAKVDDLMALCDELEAQQQERVTRHAALARASLARFADAPTPANLPFLFHPSYAIPPADLRKSILTLAVQGKLVPQDPNDEPAEVLLARLMSRDVQASGRRKKSQPDLAFTADEIPFELPSGWAWERLGNIGETNIGLTYSPQDVSDVGIPVLRSSNVQNGKLDFEDLVRVKCEPKQSAMVQDGDLLICARNGSRALVGKVAVIEGLTEPAAFGAFMAIFRSEVNQYLYHFIRSPLFRQMIDEVNTTTINQITQGNLRSTLAPIPPLAEQRRIVAKVEQLMVLVDELETQLAASRATAANLLEAVVAELTAQEVT